MLFALCSSVEAQQPGKISRIGYLDGSTAAGSAVLVDAFLQKRSELGWIAENIISILLALFTVFEYLLLA